MPNRHFGGPRSPLQRGHDEIARHRVLFTLRKNPALRQLLQFPIKSIQLSLVGGMLCFSIPECQFPICTNSSCRTLDTATADPQHWLLPPAVLAAGPPEN